MLRRFFYQQSSSMAPPFFLPGGLNRSSSFVIAHPPRLHQQMCNFFASADEMFDDLQRDAIAAAAAPPPNSSPTSAAEAVASSSPLSTEEFRTLISPFLLTTNMMPSAEASSSTTSSAAATAENNSSISSLTSRIVKLTSVAADRKERGAVSAELEEQFGSGSSAEWLPKKNNINNPDRAAAAAATAAACGGCDPAPLLLGVDEDCRHLSFDAGTADDKHKQLAEAIKRCRKSSSAAGATGESEISRLVSSAMQGTLLHARSPSEARRALEFVAVASKFLPAADEDKSKKLMMLPIWYPAVQAAALSLSTPELFEKLFDEALTALNAKVSSLEEAAASISVSAAEEQQQEQQQLLRTAVSNLHLISEAMFTAALAWAASQYELETGLKAWASSLKTSQRLQSLVVNGSSGNNDDSAVIMIEFIPPLLQLSLLIRSTATFGAGGVDPCKIDGGIRESALKWIKKQIALVASSSSSSSSAAAVQQLEQKWAREVAAMHWQNFVSLSSAVDAATGVKLMKMRIAANTKRNAASKNQQTDATAAVAVAEETAENEEDENLMQHAESLLELLKKFVSIRDISSMEKVGDTLLKLRLRTRSSMTNDLDQKEKDERTVRVAKLRKIKSKALLSMMRGHCLVYEGRPDFDSALHLFTKHCRALHRQKMMQQQQNDDDDEEEEHENNTSPFFFSCPPTADHYSLLLRNAPSPDAASSLFLDACAAGVVLDDQGYRHLFRRESKTSLRRMQQDAEALAENKQQQQQQATSTVAAGETVGELKLPPIPMKLDANRNVCTHLEEPVPQF